MNTIAVGVPHREIAPVDLIEGHASFLIWAKNPDDPAVVIALDLLKELILKTIEDDVLPALLPQLPDGKEYKYEVPRAQKIPIEEGGFVIHVDLQFWSRMLKPDEDPFNFIMYHLNLSGMLYGLLTELAATEVQAEDFTSETDEENEVLEDVLGPLALV